MADPTPNAAATCGPRGRWLAQAAYDALARYSVLAVVCALVSLWATPAAAWVQYRSSAGCGVRWLSPTGAVDGPVEVTLATDNRGLPGYSQDSLQDAVLWATAQWQQVQCPAGDVTVPDAVANQPLGVTFRLTGAQPVAPIGACAQANPDGSCLSVAPNGNFVTVLSDKKAWIYGGFLYGLTVLTYRESDGEIVDGDILLNDAQYNFCAGICATDKTAVVNTLTHEVGHLLGLDHSLVPASTMFANAGPTEVVKSTLHGDDAQGVCWLYRHTCAEPAVPAATTKSAATSDGCAAGRTADATLPALVLGLVLLLWSLLRCTSTSCTDRT